MTKKNIFLTGAPSSGKTTIIKKIISSLKFPANGFYTEEERVDEKRVGFMMHSLDGKKGYLAHQDIESDFRIRRYGVDMENVNTIAADSILPVEKNLIVLDEIGKMECFSENFKESALKALNSENIVVGTITFGGDEFIREIKARPDIEITEVTEENRNQLPGIILEKVALLIGKQGQ